LIALTLIAAYFLTKVLLNMKNESV